MASTDGGLPDGAASLGGLAIPDFFELLPVAITCCRILRDETGALDFVFLYANRRYEEGLGDGPLRGRRISEALPIYPTRYRALLAMHARVAAGGGPESLDVYQAPLKRWLTVQSFSPAPEHFVALFTEVGDTASGARLRSIFDAMAEGFVVQNREGEIIDHNIAAQRILGLGSDEIRGRTSMDPRWRAVREDLTPMPADEHASMTTLRTGRALRGRIMGVEAPGRGRRWLSVNSAPISDEGDPPEYVVSTFVDITDRKEAEARQLATLESMSQGYLALDADWRFVYLNAEAERMLGVTRGEMLGRELWEAYPAALGTPVETAYRAAADGRPTAFENFYAPWGRWFQGRCFPREAGGIHVYFDDVTAEHRTRDELQRSRDELQRSRDELRQLVAKMNTVTEAERIRIAREIHDELQQSLAAVRMDVAGLRRRIPSDDARALELLAGASSSIDQLIESTRRIIGDLRPAVLDTLGLSAALHAMADRLRARSGQSVVVRVLGPAGADANLPAEVADCLYRIAQEALNNVQKHAGARRIRLVLDLRDRKLAKLEVFDDGRGIDSGKLHKPGSFGLLGMRERLYAIGGNLSVEAGPRGGTRVRAWVGSPTSKETPAS